jgi:hypothetical protein
MTPTLAISATGLRKSFGDKLVLDGIDLAVAEGTIFAPPSCWTSSSWPTRRPGRPRPTRAACGGASTWP